VAGYMPVGNEILRQLKSRVDILCAAVGHRRAAGRCLACIQGRPMQRRIVALEPAESPTLSTGKAGRIE
jgi:cysteine synthase A